MSCIGSNHAILVILCASRSIRSTRSIVYLAERMMLFPMTNIPRHSRKYILGRFAHFTDHKRRNTLKSQKDVYTRWFYVLHGNEKPRNINEFNDL